MSSTHPLLGSDNDAVLHHDHHQGHDQHRAHEPQTHATISAKNTAHNPENDIGFSLFASGVGARLLIALALCALLWAGVIWALSEVVVA